MPRLSKSRIMSSLQCLKRVHLEVHQPELATVSASTQAAFDVGHQVGEIAVEVYGQGQGEFLAYEDGLGHALGRTKALLGGTERMPVFEATIQHQGVLIREDVLLPSGSSWKIVEVKASTKRKNEHVQDCAIQAWVHMGAGYDFESFALAHIDNQFVYGGDGDYRGILVEEDLTEAVLELQSSVPVWVDRAKQVVDGPEPDIPAGQHCFTPYECPFFSHCWPVETEYPVHCLKGSRKKLGELVTAGYRDLRDVPAEMLIGADPLRIRHVTRSGEAEVLPSAGEFVRALDYPRYYLDFETIGPAIPIWPDTRPYQALPFQYSCHIEEAPGEIRQVEFLDMSGEPPMRALAEQMIADLGETGPVLMYTAYEKGVINGLIERFPDLAPALQAIVDRLVDLYPVTKSGYYHPDMLGSWSIKAVIPTVAPELDYEHLAGIKEGTEASNAYLAAIQPGSDPAEKERVRQELLEYCRADTLAMVRLAEFFAAR
ncbi:MAG: DUF2779 domain-containing protein [Xanthomonadales bacterium]|nr:DUF2779 domain-containing protein [Xanthomonadales bacterium]NIX13808.1 DUF2779 domain-containing protein [Xanthomonadales bacterium]